jgi:hypothetical protein
MTDLREPGRVRLITLAVDHVALACVRCGESLGWASARPPYRVLEFGLVELAAMLAGHRCAGGVVEW